MPGHSVSQRPDPGHAGIEQALGAFSLLRDYFQGAIVVDTASRITWIDQRYRELLKLAPDFDPTGVPVEEVIPNSLLRRVVETGKPILLDIMRFDDRQFVVCRIPFKDEEGRIEGAIGFVFYDNVDYLEPILEKFETLQKQLSRAQAALTRERQTKYSLSSFVGASDAVKELKSQVRRFALREGAALILGETGTGKELLAHAIHQQSDRAEGPFVAVNVRGGARAIARGRVLRRRARRLHRRRPEAAPGQVRARPWRDALPRRDRRHAGGDPGQVPARAAGRRGRGARLQRRPARSMSASSRRPRRISRPRWRTSRSAPTSTTASPCSPSASRRLRERREDIAILCETLLEQTMRAPGQRGWVLLPEAMRLLESHDWPGNVRELRNVLERAAALAPSEVLDAAAIRRAMPQLAPRPAPPSTVASTGDLASRLAEAEREAILAALDASQGEKLAAARRLGVSRSQFYEKLRRHNITS